MRWVGESDDDDDDDDDEDEDEDLAMGSTPMVSCMDLRLNAEMEPAASME